MILLLVCSRFRKANLTKPSNLPEADLDIVTSPITIHPNTRARIYHPLRFPPFPHFSTRKDVIHS
jgi:hypothetical protein